MTIWDDYVKPASPVYQKLLCLKTFFDPIAYWLPIDDLRIAVFSFFPLIRIAAAST